jgi:hypothetical protein
MMRSRRSIEPCPVCRTMSCGVCHALDVRIDDDVLRSIGFVITIPLLLKGQHGSAV